MLVYLEQLQFLVLLGLLAGFNSCTSNSHCYFSTLPSSICFIKSVYESSSSPIVSLFLFSCIETNTINNIKAIKIIIDITYNNIFLDSSFSFLLFLFFFESSFLHFVFFFFIFQDICSSLFLLLNIASFWLLTSIRILLLTCIFTRLFFFLLFLFFFSFFFFFFVFFFLPI